MGFAAERGECAGDDGEAVGGWDGVGGGECLFHTYVFGSLGREGMGGNWRLRWERRIYADVG